MQESPLLDEPKSRLESLLEHCKEYISTSFDIVKLKAIEKSVSVLSGVVSGIIVGVMFLFALVFLSIGCAWWISTSLNSPFAGFLIVGAVYLLVAVVILAAKKSIVESPMSNAIIKQVFKEEQV